MRYLTVSILLLAVGAWIYIGLLPAREALLYNEIRSKLAGNETEGIYERIEKLPLVDHTAGHVTNILMNSRSADHTETARNLVNLSLRRNPANAQAWIDLAQLEAMNNDYSLSKRYLDHANELWPVRPGTLWRQALIYIDIREYESAVDSLVKYMRSDPAAFDKAFYLARRLTTDIDGLMDRAFNEQNIDLSDNSNLERIIRYVRKSNDYEVAKAVWGKIRALPEIDNRILNLLFKFSVTQSDAELAIDIWESIHGESRDSYLYNGSFETEIGNRPLSWDLTKSRAFTWRVVSQNCYSERRCLELSFKDKPEIPVTALSRVFRVHAGQNISLSGIWRGDGNLAINSGVFAEVRAAGTDLQLIARTEIENGIWPWKAFGLDFTVPDNVSFVKFNINRSVSKNTKKYSAERSTWIMFRLLTDCAIQGRAIKKTRNFFINLK